jgi:2-polyprenyl-3-methyl-5-hydroxy-6-metoxy-1,4-benzoquinol methylase
MMPVIMDLGRLQDQVVESFRRGGGVPYSAYPEFQEVQGALTAPMLDAALVDGILPLAAGLAERLQAGGEALDIGCGAGHASNVLAAAFPNSSFAGYDFATDGVELAGQESAERGLTNTRFETRDIAGLDERDRYDLVTAIEVVHDLARPEKVLRGVYEALKPGGVFLAVDINASSNLEENLDHPIGPGLFMFSIFHCMTVSLAQGGAGLGTVVGEQTVSRLIEGAGFESVEVKHIEGDFFYSYYIASK